MQLRAILDSVAERDTLAGEAAGLDRNLAALAEVRRVAPSVTAEVLGHPQVGAWAGHCLRRLRFGPRHPAPLWVDLAHLGAIAAVAAARAGAELDTAVPVRRGHVSLPSLGRVRVPAGRPWELARCAVRSGTVRLRTAHATVAVPTSGQRAGAHWQPLHRLRLSAAGLEQSVELDDLDPYRDGYGFAAGARLAGPELAQWRAALDRAWRILAGRHRARAAGIRDLLVTIVPLAADAGSCGASATSRDANGAAALTLATGGHAMAVSLVHEVEHSKLNALHDLVALVEPGPARPVYSPWREDPRPVFGLLHGTYAFLAVAEFWRAERAGPAATTAELEFARISAQVRTGHDILRSAAGLSPAGRRVVDGIGCGLRRWRDEHVSVPAERRAAELNTRHWIRWRLRHVTPDARTVDALAARLPANLVGGKGRPGPPHQPPPGGDLDLRSRWARRAAGRLGTTTGGGAELLRSQPELVYAVAERAGLATGESDPVELADWLSESGRR